jgi:hypothetical protein
VGCGIRGHPCAKGSILYGLDQLSTAENARELMERLARAIADKATNDFSELEVTFDHYLFSPLNLEPARTPSNMAYLKRWFDGNLEDALFPEFQPVAPIFALGVLKTIEESLKTQPRPLPIDAWWILDHNTFQIITLVSRHQVTMLLATPRPSTIPPTAIWSPSADAWTTGRLGVVTRQLPNRPR